MKAQGETLTGAQKSYTLRGRNDSQGVTLLLPQPPRFLSPSLKPRKGPES